MSYYSCRYHARAASSIGDWRGIFEMISFGCIVMNLAIVFFTSKALNDWEATKDLTKLNKFLVVILVEHIIILIKVLLAVIIKDKPEWVQKEQQESEHRENALYKMLEDKEEAFIAA